MPARPVKVPEIVKASKRKASDAQAEECGAGLVVPDRLQRLSEWRMHDHPHDDDADRKKDEDVVATRKNEAGRRPRPRDWWRPPPENFNRKQ
jgi:hypothetical protein